MALCDSSVLLAHWSEATHFSVFVDWVASPVDARVSSDCVVGWIYKNNFIEFIRRVLVDPVWVQHSQVRTSATHTFFRNRSLGSLWFQFCHTLVGWLTIGVTLWSLSLSVSSSNSASVDNKSCSSAQLYLAWPCIQVVLPCLVEKVVRLCGSPSAVCIPSI